jgi:hypothetical protein
VTYEQAAAIPERQRTSAQQKVVAEWEWEHAKTAQPEAQPQQVPVTHDPVLFESYERLLVAIAHLENLAGPYDPKVAQHEDYITYTQFKALSAKDREQTNHWVNHYFNEIGLTWTVT